MTKRIVKRRTRTGEFNAAHYQTEETKVRALFPGTKWSPETRDPMRDQRYVKNVKPRSEGQAVLMKAVDEHNLVLALGPAGTGKTYLAVAKAVEALEAGSVSRIVLSRPAVEAGESIGFLPGAMEEKLAPYLRPLYDALADRLSPKRLQAMMQEGLIEIAPIGYMRGRTLNNAFVVVDEAQNCTYVQLKMLLTRLGWNATMVVTGDPAQSDLLPGMSGLGIIADKLEPLEDIAVCRLAAEDIVRHPLVATMLTVL
ncbi:PhoH family protein [uncultured Maricaulis sp.]|uniref:PhoH family protein n=1 Tax=uncultured Maricaulis sp. TaxID=174710 RepID=UPI0030DAF64C|tara:strand:+ start:7466 stop:8230 length:765 start_codon:yes stop_codon:yes gene_type:complete